jgi:hypothetical protein
MCGLLSGGWAKPPQDSFARVLVPATGATVPQQETYEILTKQLERLRKREAMASSARCPGGQTDAAQFDTVAAAAEGCDRPVMRGVMPTGVCQ